MPQIDRYEHGQFCWTDLATSDAQAAKDFYAAVLGWQAEEQEIPGGVYTMFRVGGKDAAGCFKQGEEEKGIPPHWNVYVNVDDVDQMTKRAEQGGGTVLAQPFDVMEMGRMSVITDPTGGAFSLWQFKADMRTGVIREPGALSWIELYTPDTKKAGDYYTDLLGWTSEEQEMPTGIIYTVFNRAGQAEAGMMAPPPEAGEIPPFWMVYFGVEDAKATAAKVEELGGGIDFPPAQIPEVGWVATFADPQGARFAVLQPEEGA